MAIFHQESRLTGTFTAQLLDNVHLRIEHQRPFGKPTHFTIDVACLAPALAITAREGLPGFALAALLAAGLGALAVYGLARDELLPPLAWGTMAVTAALLTAGLGVAFRLRLLKRLVFQTRCAGLALLVTPVLPDKRSDMEAFLALVRLRIGEAETKRALNAERFRSGELKTLRRLAQERVIPARMYEEAKTVILSR